MRIDPSPGAGGSSHLRLVVPELAAHPMVDAGCCMFPADELICDALQGIPGIHGVRCDSTLGEVRVDFDLATDPTPLIRTILEGVGYPSKDVDR